MIVKYSAYSYGGKYPMITRTAPPGRRKYPGKKAEIEAIRRIHGREFPENTEKKEINAYLREHFPAGSKALKEYLNVLGGLQGEMTAPGGYVLAYSLDVELPDDFPEADLDDERLMRHIFNHVMGTPSPKIKKMPNPIISVRKYTKAKTIDEAFADLVQQRDWYGSVSRSTANFDKRYFRDGKLSYEKKRFYLERTGYKVVQPELWVMNDESETKME